MNRMREGIKILYLIELMKLGAKDSYIKAPTTYLSKVLGVSQQTASRVMIELDRDRLIERKIVNGVTCIKLTRKAIEMLIKFKKVLDDAFKKPGFFELRGRVFTGIGEGAYYMKKRAYAKQFLKKLGFRPYPGTLNVRLESNGDIELNKKLREMKGMKIIGFKNGLRTYGDVYVFRAVIEDKVEGAVIYATRTHYDTDVIELISPYYLREKLGLKDGDIVRFRVFLSEKP